MTEKNTYKPTNDYVFSRIFGYERNWELLKDLLEAILTDIKIKKIELVIQLPKFREKCKRISNKLEQWLTFIVNDDVEAIKMIDNEFVQKAEDELEFINSDEEERMRAKFRERCEWNYNFDMESMYSAGKTEGVKEGIKEQSVAIAKKMLAKKIDIETIIETTGLTKDEIEKLKE